jgi:glycosyltransferase involved in cell wall biosynthesis
MPREPLVTVLMSVFNDVRFLPESVESILGQTFGDFQFIIIDDGSSDGSWDYLASLNDPRLRLIRNPRNVGLTASLNVGLALSTGRYIARMDADDISEPDRLQKQFAFLESHPEIGIVGSSRMLIDEVSAVLSIANAVQGDLEIRWKCLLGNPFAHPAVMLRREVLAHHHLRYDESFRTAQDYEFWTRLLQHTHGENLPEPLIRYRLRDGISRRSKAEQLANHDRIVALANQRLLPAFPLNRAEIRELRGRYGGFSVREEGMEPGEDEWVSKYLAMLDTFCAGHVGREGIEVLRDGVETRLRGACGQKVQNVIACP